MAIQLNHTIVHARDKRESAAFFTEIFGLPAATPFAGPFLVVHLDNGVSLDFIDAPAPIAKQHYAFLVSDAEWDAIFARIRARGLPYWADPARTQPNQTNTHFGGRGVYWEDPSGHFLEIITTPYGETVP